MIVRPVRSADLSALIDLARSTGTGLTTLPANEERLSHRVGWAEKTFLGEAERADADYLFVMEDDDGKVVGISAVAGAVGLREVRESFEAEWGVTLPDTPGLRIPQMFDAALAGQFRGLYCQGEDIAQSDPDSRHVTAALRAMDFIVMQDLFHNETARFAHVLLPGSSFLEKDGTFTNAERRVSRIRQVMAPLGGLADWQVTCALSAALGYPMPYTHPSEIMDEIARLTPTFASISYPLLERLGSVQWPCNALAPEGTAVLHRDTFTRGRGMFNNTRYVPTTEQSSARYPLILTTGRILPHYNVGTQTRRSANVAWAGHDQLHIHPLDAASRGIGTGDRKAYTRS